MAETNPGRLSWRAGRDALADIEQRQLFFIGGAPRSGTTWVQLLFDAHPDVCCKGEGLFPHHLEKGLTRIVEEWRQALSQKNNTLFRQSGGYQLPDDEDVDFLLATGILRAFNRQCRGGNYSAIGEKTPENVFLFPRLKRLFPHAKFVGVVRDPRDALTSALHIFYKAARNEGHDASPMDFILHSLGPMIQGTKAMLALCSQYPSACAIVSYEALIADPKTSVSRLFDFLGVESTSNIVDACLAKTAFSSLSGGRAPGEGRNSEFFRKGVVGDWKETLTPEINRVILDAMGEWFPFFGWKS